MVDVVDKATRSRMMSGIRGKNTQPEILIRHGLHRIGFRYRLHGSKLPGRPDIVLPKYKAVILVHGCFWHGHDCRYFKLPSTRTDFWHGKIDGNRARDGRNTDSLLTAGWRVCIVWECAVRGRDADTEKVCNKVARWIRGKSPMAEFRGE